MKLFLSLIVMLVLSGAIETYPHSGGRDSYGCHMNSTLGKYECHSGQFAGRVFASKDAMLAELNASPVDARDKVIADLRAEVERLKAEIAALKAGTYTKTVVAPDGAVWGLRPASNKPGWFEVYRADVRIPAYVSEIRVQDGQVQVHGEDGAWWAWVNNMWVKVVPVTPPPVTPPPPPPPVTPPTTGKVEFGPVNTRFDPCSSTPRASVQHPVSGPCPLTLPL